MAREVRLLGRQHLLAERELRLPARELRLLLQELRLSLRELRLLLLEVRLPLLEFRLLLQEVRLSVQEFHLPLLEVRLQDLVGHLLGAGRAVLACFAMKPITWDGINPNTGAPLTWDDPNLRWGDPSYVLEPGDPGYTPPTPTPPPMHSTKQPKPTKMKHNTYYPTNVPSQILWLTNFYNKLITHAPTLGIDTTVCAARVADARYLIYLLADWQPAERAWNKSTTDFIREAQLGTGSAPIVQPVFVPPPLPGAVGGLPAVVAVPPGALTRILSLVQVMQESPGFIDSIATDLGTVGTADSGPDMNTIQPVFDLKIVGNQVFIDWGWGGFSAHLDLLQIQVDRGNGFVDLAYDTTPGYTDTQPFPSTPTKWKYRGIYRVGETPVGVWSATKEILVG